MDRILHAHTFNEIKYYLTVTPCEACGKGPLVLESPNCPGTPQEQLTIEVRCKSCDQVRSLSFSYDHDLPLNGPQSEYINPTDEPSRIVDLGGWLSLFYLLVESAWREKSPPQVRESGLQAAMCLTEALKFYGDDELPPESAFFTPESSTAFRGHPEKFARQRLRDMQEKLPSVPRMARRVERDKTTRTRRWWSLRKR